MSRHSAGQMARMRTVSPPSPTNNHHSVGAPIGEHVSPSAVAARAGRAVRGPLTSAGER